MIASLSFPTLSYFGPGAVDRLRPELMRLGINRPLLVTDQNLAASSILPRVRSLCVTAVVFSGVRSNPAERDVLDGAELHVTEQCDGIVGLGGGSVLDAAKAIRLKVNHPLPLWEYDSTFDGWRKITGEMPPFIAIPTTAGTGSEVSPYASITIERSNLKIGVRSAHLLPTVALIDPELTLSLPPAITFGSGMNAFASNVEAFLSHNYNPVCDALAQEGVRLAAAMLPRLVEDPAGLECRTAMMMSALMGAMAGEKGLGAVHSLANPLCGEFGLHCGSMKAVLLPVVLRYYYDTESERMMELARRASVADLIDTAAELAQVSGIAPRLRDHGVPETALPMLARRAIQDDAHLYAPRACSEEDMLALYRRAW
ncbi:MAG: iron-containing alcohol dehydrogenase [Bryobacteraceae bacterium]|nr:iron-containing alcohol dehydrogenase [Bryobacteraceae bacterium]